MKVKHIPLRKCIGCGQKNSKENFIMVVRPPKKEENSSLQVLQGENKKGGRSAYICASLDCLKKARKTRRLERIFRSKQANEAYILIERML